VCGVCRAAAEARAQIYALFRTPDGAFTTVYYPAVFLSARKIVS
jgi:hypothetical protein